LRVYTCTSPLQNDNLWIGVSHHRERDNPRHHLCWACCSPFYWSGQKTWRFVPAANIFRQQTLFGCPLPFHLSFPPSSQDCPCILPAHAFYPCGADRLWMGLIRKPRSARQRAEIWPLGAREVRSHLIRQSTRNCTGVLGRAAAL